MSDINRKMREEFESWVVSNWPNQSLDRFNPLHGVTEGEYTGFTVQHCWDAWKASREAVAIELPEHLVELNDSEEMASGFNSGVITCRKQIEAAGVQVKS